MKCRKDLTRDQIPNVFLDSGRWWSIPESNRFQMLAPLNLDSGLRWNDEHCTIATVHHAAGYDALSSPRRRPGSRPLNRSDHTSPGTWIPACAGMTNTARSPLCITQRVMTLRRRPRRFHRDLKSRVRHGGKRRSVQRAVHLHWARQ